jgi:hypothetical protein
MYCSSRSQELSVVGIIGEISAQSHNVDSFISMFPTKGEKHERAIFCVFNVMAGSHAHEIAASKMASITRNLALFQMRFLKPYSQSLVH